MTLETALGLLPTGLVDNPLLFQGFLSRPDVAASALLAVADVAATRYADFGLAKRIQNLDPVVTASGDRLRFESFSVCNGVHARFDLLDDGIDSGTAAFGTTNVDINQPLRSALAGIGRSALLHLSVGSDQLRVSTPDASYVEREVTLSERWVRGFAETPLLARDSVLRAVIDGPAAVRFLGALPKAAPPGPDLHVGAGPAGLRRQLRGPGAILLAGSARLRAAARIARFATRLRVYASEIGTSGWVFDLPGGRFTLLLTPHSYRGFSGEGSLLTLLADPAAEQIGQRLASQLSWQAVIDPELLASSLGLERDDVDNGLAWLAANGRVGYDLAETAWFHRDLPIDVGSVVKRNPRLVSAEKLLAKHPPSRRGDGWLVVGSEGQRYQVGEQNGSYQCTCMWEHEHHGTRGPCKHILTVLIMVRSTRQGSEP